MVKKESYYDVVRVSEWLVVRRSCITNMVANISSGHSVHIINREHKNVLDSTASLYTLTLYNCEVVN